MKAATAREEAIGARGKYLLGGWEAEAANHEGAEEEGKIHLPV